MTDTFHWAFDDTQAAVEHPGWKFECRAAECQKGICPKCHQALEDGRAYCPMCVAEHADPRASSIAQRQRAEKAEAAIERVRTIHHFAECSNVRCKLGGWCIGCDPDASESCAEHPWPCPTVLALEPDAKLPDVYADWVLRRDHDRAVARLADLLAWQRAYIDAHPETGTLDLIEATVASLATPEAAPLPTQATPAASNLSLVPPPEFTVRLSGFEILRNEIAAEANTLDRLRAWLATQDPWSVGCVTSMFRFSVDPELPVGEVHMRPATPSRTTPDNPVTSGDAADIAGEQP